MQFLKIDEKENISETLKGISILINPNAIAYICTALDGFSNHTNITMTNGKIFKVNISYQDLKNRVDSINLQNI